MIKEGLEEAIRRGVPAGAQEKLFRPDWKGVFEPESVRAQLESILEPPSEGSDR